MAMRDPGRPRRNPLFAGDPAAVDSGPGERGSPADGPARPSPAALAAVVAALQDAGPEATEHLAAAAHELVLAIKVLVDAAERALAEQRAAPERGGRDAAPSRSAPGRIRHIDLA